MEKSVHKYDVYHMMAKENDYRARSAYKLIQLDEDFHILKNVTRVVDLCAAPGSWSQVLSRKLYMGDNDLIKPVFIDPADMEEAKRNDNVKIVAVDLADMKAVPGVIQLKGDINQIETARQVIVHFGDCLADVVVCDGATDISVSHSMGDFAHGSLIFAAIHITCNVLKKGGCFIVKVFRCRLLNTWIRQMSILFESVEICKPDSSRKTSPECFLVCQNYSPPENFDPTLLTAYTNHNYRDFSTLTGINRKVIPILVSDDLTGMYPMIPADINLLSNINDAIFKIVINEQTSKLPEFVDIETQISSDSSSSATLSTVMSELVLDSDEKRSNETDYITKISPNSKPNNLSSKTIDDDTFLRNFTQKLLAEVSNDNDSCQMAISAVMNDIITGIITDNSTGDDSSDDIVDNFGNKQALWLETPSSEWTMSRDTMTREKLSKEVAFCKEALKMINFESDGSDGTYKDKYKGKRISAEENELGMKMGMLDWLKEQKK